MFESKCINIINNWGGKDAFENKTHLLVQDLERIITSSLKSTRNNSDMGIDVMVKARRFFVYFGDSYSRDQIKIYEITPNTVVTLGIGAFSSVYSYACIHKPNKRKAGKVQNYSAQMITSPSIRLFTKEQMKYKCDYQPGQIEIEHNMVLKIHHYLDQINVPKNQRVGVPSSYKTFRAKSSLIMFFTHADGNGVELSSKLRKLNYNSCALLQITKQLVQGLSTCQQAGIVLGDIKLENIVYIGTPGTDNFRVYFIDLAGSRSIDSIQTNLQQCTNPMLVVNSFVSEKLLQDIMQNNPMQRFEISRASRNLDNFTLATVLYALFFYEIKKQDNGTSYIVDDLGKSILPHNIRQKLRINCNFPIDYYPQKWREIFSELRTLLYKTSVMEHVYWQ